MTKPARTNGRNFFIPKVEAETLPAVVVPTTNKKRKIFFPQSEATLPKQTIFKESSNDAPKVFKPRAPKKWIDKNMVIEDGKKYKGRNNWRENSPRAYLLALKNGVALMRYSRKKYKRKKALLRTRKNTKAGANGE